MIYLASPYSHPDPAVREARYGDACRAAAALVARGESVFCPVAHSHGIAVAGRLDPSWDAWRAADLHLLEACDDVVVLRLPGWRESAGVAAEVAHAQHCGIPVCHFDLAELEEMARG